MSTVADALAGARYQAPAPQRTRTVLVAGAAGRLGERVLAHVLACRDYRHIYVLASEPLRSTENRLQAVSASHWNTRVDDVIAIVGEHETASLPAAPRKRTGIFSMLTADDVPSLAQQAEMLGVARFMLVTPTDVLSQPAAIYAQLANLMEESLHRLRFESLLLVRPSDQEIRSRRAGMAQRFWGLLASTAAGFMVGQRHMPLSIENTARAVVLAMLGGRPGLTIIEMDRLHQLLKPDACVHDARQRA
jgi:hypothetical protein